jgi:hypothetical protein
VRVELHLLVYRGTVRHSDSKERRGEVCGLRHRVHHFLKFTPYFLGGPNHCRRRPKMSRRLDTGSSTHGIQ